MSFETIVVEFDISIQDIIGVDAFLLHSFNHADCTKVGEERIIDLDVSASSLVQIGDFLTVCFGDIRKVSFFSRIDVFVEGKISMTKMEPFWSSLCINFSILPIYHGHFDVFDLVLGNILSKEGESIDITRPNASNFSGTKPGFSSLESFRLESSNIRNICISRIT
jgi:hypothetical protein